MKGRRPMEEERRKEIPNPFLVGGKRGGREVIDGSFLPPNPYKLLNSNNGRIYQIHQILNSKYYFTLKNNY